MKSGQSISTVELKQQQELNFAKIQKDNKLRRQRFSHKQLETELLLKEEKDQELVQKQLKAEIKE